MSHSDGVRTMGSPQTKQYGVIISIAGILSSSTVSNKTFTSASSHVKFKSAAPYAAISVTHSFNLAGNLPTISTLWCTASNADANTALILLALGIGGGAGGVPMPDTDLVPSSEFRTST